MADSVCIGSPSSNGIVWLLVAPEMPSSNPAGSTKLTKMLSMQSSSSLPHASKDFSTSPGETFFRVEARPGELESTAPRAIETWEKKQKIDFLSNVENGFG
jgi:hypothetical protein